MLAAPVGLVRLTQPRERLDGDTISKIIETEVVDTRQEEGEGG